MKGRDIALTGVPRGGTTLACHLLHACVETIALFEPMDVTTLELPASRALDRIEAFYSETRSGLLAFGTAPSKHIDGTVPDNPFGDRDMKGSRQLLVDHGRIALGRPAENFTLVVKHNAAFCALLPALAERFDSFAIVRNPLAVLASWNTVDLPVSHGRIPAGERLDPVLRRQLEGEPTCLERQLTVLGWFFRRFQLYLPPARVLRYEDIVGSGGEVLRRATGLEGVARDDLSLRNASTLYHHAPIPLLADALLRKVEAPWAAWYDRNAISDLATTLAVIDK